MITRFAPSPTGPLHLGHAYAAIFAHDMAKAAGGRFLLRIEDIDQSRARPHWEAQIFEDLAWLGLTWEAQVLRQSERINLYRAALTQLWEMGLLYPCSCNRRDIEAAASAPQEGATPRFGPDGIIYPGTCRSKPRADAMPQSAPLRLDMAKAVALTGEIAFVEKDKTVTTLPSQMIENVGDIILARKDMGTSYHLSVVIDDSAQSITDVTRGEDLFEATAIHVLLQRLLGLKTPHYHHHGLVRDENGKRLAKRDDARALALYRSEGTSPEDIRQMIGLRP